MRKKFKNIRKNKIKIKKENKTRKIIKKVLKMIYKIR
jgi:hypothetical protein